MLSEGLIFGRENIAYAVLALYSDAVNEKPVVVSLHLGAISYAVHDVEDAVCGGHVQFVVRRVRINGNIEVIDDPQISHNQPQRPTRRVVRIVRKS